MLPSRYTRGNDVYKVFAAYVAAKILEAALAGYFVLRMIALRSPVEAPPRSR